MRVVGEAGAVLSVETLALMHGLRQDGCIIDARLDTCAAASWERLGVRGKQVVEVEVVLLLVIAAVVVGWWWKVGLRLFHPLEGGRAAAELDASGVSTSAIFLGREVAGHLCGTAEGRVGRATLWGIDACSR